MSMTLIRLGVWALIAILAAYVLVQTLPDSAIAEVMTDRLLFLLTQGAVGVVALGLIIALIEKLWGLRRRKCKTCGRPIASTALYCRLHLNEVLEEEDLRHRTMNTKLPE